MRVHFEISVLVYTRCTESTRLIAVGLVIYILSLIRFIDIVREELNARCNDIDPCWAVSPGDRVMPGFVSMMSMRTIDVGEFNLGSPPIPNNFANCSAVNRLI